jgi:hypothetical protein
MEAIELSDDGDESFIDWRAALQLYNTSIAGMARAREPRIRDVGKHTDMTLACYCDQARLACGGAEADVKLYNRDEDLSHLVSLRTCLFSSKQLTYTKYPWGGERWSHRKHSLDSIRRPACGFRIRGSHMVCSLIFDCRLAMAVRMGFVNSKLMQSHLGLDRGCTAQVCRPLW